MQNQQQSDRLSWGDTVFLHLEREGMPLNVASVCVFEGKIPFQNCVRFVESKLRHIPRYLKRVVPEPLGLGLPSWDYDPEFDLRRHLREAALKHGTETELKAFAAKLFSQVMDRRHPLWDITIVQGLKGNRTGLIIRMHHCLTDGIAGVGLMNTLLDASPVAPRLPKKNRRIRVPASQCDPLNSLASGALDSYSDFVQRILSAWADVLSIAERVAGDGGKVTAEELSRLLPEITSFAERLRFNVIYRGPQKFAWAKIPLQEIKAIRKSCGASVNDVLLALVTSTVRRYSELHGERVKGRLLRMMVPVNLRGDDSRGALGNRISIVPVTVPLDIRNPRKLLSEVHRRTELLKHAHTAELVSLAGGMIGILPSALQAFAGPLMSQLPITPFNMVCTNVPGPQYPLYLLGHKMLQWYPYVPVGGEMAVNCAILSYDGTVYFGFSGDVHAAPDLRRLEQLLKASYVELRDAVRPRRKGTAPPKKVRAKSQAAAKPATRAVREAIAPSIPPSVAPAQGPRPNVEEEKVLAELIA
ncbi:MAG TPA: wax ester/triacylglycerol synthase family O-acyltransferase [Candidatus Limnocylindrales bacterium]|nr:wax ester/triacylglycerol synthase family O-acyltransferase [Candidatus Limnocylindrales bacterium]